MIQTQQVHDWCQCKEKIGMFCYWTVRLLSLCDKYFSVHEFFLFFHMLIRHTVLYCTLCRCVEIRHRYIKIWLCTVTFWGTWWCSWLGHCTAKVMTSIPNDTIEIFHWHNTSGSTVIMGSAHSLAEMSTRNISCGGKGGQCIGLTTIAHSWAYFLEE